MPRPSRRPRILHLIHRLGDGGADRTLIRAAEGLTDLFDQTILTTHGSGSRYTELSGRVPVVDPRADPVSMTAAIEALTRAEAWPVDAVHGWVSSATILAAELAATLGCPLALRQPTNIEAELRCQGDYLRPQLGALRAAFGVADSVILPSPALATGTRRVYGACRTRVIPNAAPRVEDLPSDRPQRPDGRLVVAMVGRLVPQKNPLAAIDALLGLEDHVSWHLWIFGEGELRRAIEDRLTDELRKERVQFMGFRPDWLSFANDIDIFVQPTRFEGMSNTLLEAAAAGLAIVTTDIPENRFVLAGGHDCLLVPANDTTALRGALSRLAADPVLRATLGTAARRAARRFSLERMIEAYGQHYRELLDGGRIACAA